MRQTMLDFYEIDDELFEEPFFCEICDGLMKLFDDFSEGTKLYKCVDCGWEDYWYYDDDGLGNLRMSGIRI